MKSYFRQIKQVLIVGVVSITLAACSKNSITGRSQLAILPESELRQMAQQEYKQFLSQNKVVSPSSSN